MPFYETAHPIGPYLHIDTDGDRVLLLAADFYGDPSGAHAGEDGVIAIYPLDERLPITDLLNALVEAGTDMASLLAEYETAPLLPALRLVTAPFNPDPKE